MTTDFESLSNNEILFKIKQIEADYEALKLKMLKDYDALEKLEKEFNKAQLIITKRLKGE
jgi:hypothetical protein